MQLSHLFSETQQELEATSQHLHETYTNLVHTQEQLEETEQDLSQTRVERDERSFLVETHLRNEHTLLGEASEVGIQ